MKISWKPLLLCLAVPLAVEDLRLSDNGQYAGLCLFATATPLPSRMGVSCGMDHPFSTDGAASYLVLMSSAPADQKEMALRIYGLQLAVNFCWPLLFFRVQAFWVAFVWHHPALGADSADNPAVWKNRKKICLSFGSLSDLGYLCRIPELRRGNAQLTQLFHSSRPASENVSLKNSGCSRSLSSVIGQNHTTCCGYPNNNPLSK